MTDTAIIFSSIAMAFVSGAMLATAYWRAKLAIVQAELDDLPIRDQTTGQYVTRP